MYSLLSTTLNALNDDVICHMKLVQALNSCSQENSRNTFIEVETQYGQNAIVCTVVKQTYIYVSVREENHD